MAGDVEITDDLRDEIQEETGAGNVYEATTDELILGEGHS
ncbi:hypothetical protein P148_SR1C00001G0895 [candidate division SR1 bacterium RAAC1_SR1_1]|nr:hypothetical protein P148_SR1C00001G0895 [candidate division SR1 bacterium RAAC1_SR1_1]